MAIVLLLKRFWTSILLSCRHFWSLRDNLDLNWDVLGRRVNWVLLLLFHFVVLQWFSSFARIDFATEHTKRGNVDSLQENICIKTEIVTISRFFAKYIGHFIECHVS